MKMSGSKFEPHSLGLTSLLALCTLCVDVAAQQPSPPGQVAKNESAVNEAYLFAHMVHSDYGRLYYSVSIDGLHWYQLNDGKRITDGYKGHPSIIVGHDGRYYLAGNDNDSARDIDFWVSESLVEWTPYGSYEPELNATPEYSHALQRIGAPKLFYDAETSRYLLTWHTPHVPGSEKDPEAYWASQRTLYVTSKDLREFSSPPRKLFDWDMGVIDTTMQRAEGRYWAIIKDETYPTLDWVTGKTIRVAESDDLLGPYGNLSEPLSPNFREAPMVIPSPDGDIWYLYYEQYPGVSYGLSVADSLSGPWYQISGYTFYEDWDKYRMPPRVRHGCMIAISRNELDRLVNAFGVEESANLPTSKQAPSANRRRSAVE